MTPIANCNVEFRFQCPKQWESLEKTDMPAIRFCGVCTRDVHFCTTLEEVHHHASQGNCIAVSSSGRREHYIGEVAPLITFPLFHVLTFSRFNLSRF